jgi:3-deoxy-D-manno-octulosonic-acid transferase
MPHWLPAASNSLLTPMNTLDPLYILLAAVTAPIWGRKTRADWSARFGKIPPLERTAKPRLLLHAVSVGEVNALRELIPLLTDRADVVISVGTDTGIVQARKLYSEMCTIVRYPVDFSWAVRRFLDAVGPDAVALVELELWPNFIAACRRRGIPVGIINGRLSAHSFRGYRKLRPVLKSTFASLRFAAVQDQTYAERFIHMGVPPDRCLITGSMKWDTARIEDHVPGAEELARDMGIDRTKLLIVAGSTADTEEDLLHRACPPGVQLLCAPRKPERFDQAAAALPGCIRRSRPPSVSGTPTSDRFLLDTIGELRKAYALADVAVIGRTFADHGGSDPIEPIGLGKPTVTGPFVRNFQEISRQFQEAQAIIATDGAVLPAVLQRLLARTQERAELAARGREVIRRHQGASRRHAELLLSMLPAAAADSVLVSSS